MNWLGFLHFYFVALCAVTSGSLVYLALRVWPEIVRGGVSGAMGLWGLKGWAWGMARASAKALGPGIRCR